MASKPPPSGHPGPKKELYQKYGVKYASRGNQAHLMDQIPDLKLNSNDILLSTFAKSGTTWMQQIIALIMSGVDVEEVNKEDIDHRWMFLEFQYRRPEIERIKEAPSPRLIKTHMTYELVENQVNRDKCKTIVVMRNPKDVLVSLYHFYRTNRGLGLYTGTWDQFFEEFIVSEEVINGCPIEFCKTWWVNNQAKENVLIMFYEEMKKDLSGSVAKVASFLEKDLTKEQLETVVAEASFKSMQSNPKTNYSECMALDPSKGAFMRKGMVGDWKNHFNAEQLRYYENGPLKQLEGTTLKFDYGE